VNEKGGEEMTEFVTDLGGYVVNARELADMLGCTPQYVYTLVKQGVLVKQGPAQFPLAENVQKYLKFLNSKRSSKALYWSEKALHEKALRQMAEIRLEKLDDELHDAAAVEAIINDMVSFFRKRTMAIADEVAPKIVGMTNPGEICGILTDAVNAALDDMSNYEFREE